MSLLLAVTTAVTATPTPSVTPEVVKETLQTIVNNNQLPVVPAQVLELAQLGAVALAGLVTSLLHLIIARKKLPSNLNRLLFTLFAAVAGITTMVLNGQFQLDATGLTVGFTALLAYLGSAQGMKMLTDFIGSLQTTDSPSGAAVPLATEEPETAPV